jgi:hypothetical protein
MRRDPRGGKRQVRGRDRNDFAKWADGTEMSYEVLGAFLKVHPTTIWAWYTGKRIPDLEMAVRVERLSDGAVSVKSWVRKRTKQGNRGAPEEPQTGNGGGNEQAAS